MKCAGLPGFDFWKKSNKWDLLKNKFQELEEFIIEEALVMGHCFAKQNSVVSFVNINKG